MEHFDNLIKELYSKTYLGKCKHFHAANRNKVYKNRAGLPAILIIITLGSVLFADISKSVPDYIKWISAFLAFGAALLSGFQTYFDYQKRFEMHNNIANKFLSIEHNLYKLNQKILMNKIEFDDALTYFDELDEKYQSFVLESIPFPTNKSDFVHALNSMNLKKEKDINSLFK